MKKIFVLLLLSACFFVASAQSQITSFDVDGIKVILKPTEKEIINIRVVFRGGVNNYSSKQAGIEKFALAGTIACGTQKYPGSTLRDTAEYYGIDIGSAARLDYSDIDVECISKYFDKAWDILTQTILHPTFETSEVELLRARMITQTKIIGANTRDFTMNALFKHAFANSMYETSPAGDEKTLTGITPADLSGYIKKIVNKGQLFIVVAGKISEEELTTKIHDAFAAIPDKTYEKPVREEPVWSDYKVVARQSKQSINSVAAIMNAPQFASEDYIPYRLGISILSSVLFNDLRLHLHLSYDPYATAESLLMPYAVMYVSTSDPARAVVEMKRSVMFIKNNVINPESLQHLVNGYRLTYFLEQESTAAMTGRLANAEVLDSWATGEQLPAALNIVTAQQIAAVMNKYIKGLMWCYTGDTDIEKQMEADGVFKP